MKKTTKLTTFIIIFFIIIFSVIAGRYFVGKHFQKKFSKRPPPGVIISKVETSKFYDSIETFGTALANKTQNFRVKKDEITAGLNNIGKFVEKGDLIVSLKKENIIAPFSGIVGKREIAQGILGTDSLILTLDDTSYILLDIKIPENYLGVLKQNLKAEVRSEVFNEIFLGNVYSISSRVDPSTRSILAGIKIKNKNLKLIPGQLLKVKIIYNEIESLGVPESSLLIQGNKAFVYIVLENKTVEKKEVSIGKRNFGKVSINSGINEGDTIVKEGITKVRNKIKVKVINNN